MNFFKEINTLLKTRSVFLFYLILLLSIFTSFFDVLSLGSVGVLIGIILKPGFLNDYSNFIFINDFLKLSHVNQIYFGCVSIVILFLIKTVFIFLVFFLQGKFNYKIKKELSTKLFSAYLSKEYLFHVNNNPAILWRNINEEVDYTSQYLDLLSRLFGAICVILILFTLIIFTTPMINFSITIFLILSLLIVIFYINFKKKIKKRSEIKLNTKYIYSIGLLENLCLAIKMALDLKIKKKIIIKTIPKIKFKARIEYITKGRLVEQINKNEKILIDGCHSAASAKNLANYLKTLKIPIYGIWSMTKNKDPNKFIKEFKSIFKRIITIPIENEPASLSNKLLFKIALKNNFKTDISSNINNALKMLSSKEKKIICIFGSLYLCGNFLNKN